MIAKLRCEQETLERRIKEINQKTMVIQTINQEQVAQAGELELKLMGLEQCEEVWKGKKNREGKILEKEKQRLESLERQILKKSRKSSVSKSQAIEKGKLRKSCNKENWSNN